MPPNFAEMRHVLNIAQVSMARTDITDLLKLSRASSDLLPYFC